jgi:V/A-type H+-transporting ATPase subunit C
MKDMLKAIEGTRYHELVLPYYTEDPSEIRYSDIEHNIYVKYHDIVIERINKYYKGKDQKTLMDIYQSSVEIDNIIKIYRLRRFYNADEQEVMNAIITKNIRMSPKKLKDLINLKDPAEILKVLSRSAFAEYKDEDEYVYIEYQAEKIRYNLAKRFMYFSTFPPIVYSVFLILNRIERTNIFNIIEGIRYDIDKDDIKKMLIY